MKIIKLTILALVVSEVLVLAITECNAKNNASKNYELKEKTTTVIDIRNKIAYLPNENTPFTGIYENHSSSGYLQSKENYKNGMHNGLMTAWFENGKKLAEVYFKDGKKDGLEIMWWENGQKQSETNYTNGNKNGLDIRWNPNGQKDSETNFIDGNKDGVDTVTEDRHKKLHEQVSNLITEREKPVINEIKKRCQSQMGEHGAAMVKACVDQDLEARRILVSYMDKHEAITTRCVKQMNEHGWAMIKACADQDIEAENALQKY